MAQPKTKEQLLAESGRYQEALVALIASLSREQLAWRGAYGWSAVDHVAHLSEWERMLIDWVEATGRGENPAVPAEGYSWATMDDLNRRIFERHTNESIEQAMADWRDSSRRLAELAQRAPEGDLFATGRLPWTGRGTLASFFWECAGNHYRWAAEEIKRGLKSRR